MTPDKEHDNLSDNSDNGQNMIHEEQIECLLKNAFDIYPRVVVN